MKENIQQPYQGLSRLYRPQIFSDILGQDSVVTTLKNSLKKQNTVGAYLFTGTRGTGKTTLARVFAKALNCASLTIDIEPCGTCFSCEEMARGKNFNVIEIDGASNRGIDDIRQLSETMHYTPSHGGYKIFIIDEVHMLTKEAFNALLKILEEPPKNVKFFLATTEPHKIPLTILSRCQRFDLKRIETKKIIEKIKGILKDKSLPYEEEALYLIATLADGSMRVAESLLDQVIAFAEGPITEKVTTESLDALPKDIFFSLDKAFSEKNLAFAFSFVSSVFSSGKDFVYFLESLLEHYRNILSILLNTGFSELSPSLEQSYKESAKLYTEEQVLYIIEYIVKWYQTAAKTPCKRVTLEMLILHILRSKHRICVTSLVQRLETLQTTTTPSSPKDEKIEAPIVATSKKKEGGMTPKQETIVHFAAVELEGTFHKN